MTSRQSLARWLGGRGVLFVLLAAVVLVPALARVHQHVGRPSTDDGPRFRWSTSCESVPKKTTAIAAVEPIAIPVSNLVDPPVAARFARPAAEALATTSAVISPPGLRAPPRRAA